MILILLISIILLLSSSNVQTYFAKRFANQLSEKFKTEISISKLKITWNLHVVLEDVFVNDLYHVSLLRTDQIELKINKLSLRKKKIDFSKIILNENQIAIIKYKNDSCYNFQFLIDYFRSKDTTTKKTADWTFSGKVFEIKKTSFKYQDQHKMNFIYEGLDFNNMMLTDLNFRIDTLFFKGDTVNVDIKKLSFNDKSGFVLKNLSANIKIYSGFIGLDSLHIETPSSNLSLDGHFNYDTPEDFNNFNDKVNLNLNFKNSRLDFNDLVYFIPDLKGMNNQVNLSGSVLGQISNLKLRNFKFSYGSSTNFEGAISLNGLPDIEETFIRLKVNKFTTTKFDIECFNLPGKNKRIVVPEELLTFGNIFAKGDFTGFYYDFNAYAKFLTQNGSFETDITLKKGKNNLVSYKGHAYAKQFNIGYFFNSPNTVIGKLNFNADIEGSGISVKTAKVKMIGKINQLEFKGNVYNDIDIEGEVANNQFDGFLKVLDDKIKFNFLGKIDFADKIPVFDFSASISDANLYRLKLIDKDTTGLLSTQLKFNFTGNNADNIIGLIKVENTTYNRNGNVFSMDNLNLYTFNDSLNRRNIDLNSDYIDANIIGDFKFKDLPNTFNLFIRNYLPSFTAVKTTQSFENEKRNQNFVFKIILKNTKELSDLFMPELIVSPNSTISGSYNSVNSDFKLQGNANSIIFNNQIFEKGFFEAKTDFKRLYVSTGCKRLKFGKDFKVDNLNMFSLVQSDSIFYSFLWKDSLELNHNSGDLSGFVSFNEAPLIKMKILRSDIKVNDTIWKLIDQNEISFQQSFIKISNFEIGNQKQFLKFNGNISKNPEDKMIVTFSNFNVSQLDFLTASSNIDFNGIINGDVELIDLYNSPNFITDLTVNGLCFNSDKLGDLNLISTWDKSKNGLFIKSNLIYTGNVGRDTTLYISGYYFPESLNENFDFKVRLNQLKLESLTHYFKSFSSDFKGQAIGNLTFKGNYKRPEIQGKVLLLRSRMKIDYLGVDYTISNSDSIEINTNYFKFTNLGISNKTGRATMDGVITHDGFRDIRIDLTFMFKNLMVLKTKSIDNDLFYGDAYASGYAKISGPDNNINLEIRAKTDKGTVLNIPLVNKTVTHVNNFITFLEKDRKIVVENKSSNRFSGLTMNFKLDVTPDAEIDINLETTQTEGNIKAFGDGNIQMDIDKEGEFKIYGDYVINDGLYLFAIQNILSKKFNIQNGGSISWKGDPYNANVNLKAIYNLRASLYPILIGTAENVSKKKVPVQNIISIEGNLMNPNIEFDINLPNIDQEIKDRFYSIVDRNDKEKMVQQSFSLLVMNQFISQNRNQYSSTVGSSVSSSSAEMISNQISGWLSQISKDFDIGFNYRPGDQLSSQEVQIALSTQLFNDIVTVDGNFGVGGGVRVDNSTSGGSAFKNSEIVGDFNIEVKLTDDGRLRLKAFNRSNNNDFTNFVSPYTQGVGFFYRRDFDNIKELFKNTKTK